MKNELKKEMAEIRIDQLTKDPNHVRQDVGNLDDLISSIRKDGQRVPINVNRSADGILYYNDGFRRIEALKQIGKETVLAIVWDGYSPEDAAHESFIINSRRKALNPIEEALHIKRMNTQFDLSYKHLEIKGYGSAAQLSRKVQLLDHPEEVQNHLGTGKLTMAHGLALLDLPTEKERVNMAKRAIDYGWSANLIKNAIRRYISEGKKGIAKKESVPSIEIPDVYIKDSKDMSEQPDGSVHLIVSSPPYHIGMEYEQGYSYDDHLDNIEGVMKESARVLVPGGVIALNLNDIINFKGKKGDDKKSRVKLMGHIYEAFLRKHRCALEGVIIWMKSPEAFSTDRSKAFSDKIVHTSYKMINRHDYILIFRKEGERPIPTGEIALKSSLTKEEWDKYITSVWQIPQVRKSEGHPSIFPDELVSRLVKIFTFEGEKVLDPFLGSGTTVKVARELGREGIGYEREEKYKATILAKLGVEEPANESVGEFVQRIIEETEANQPEAPKVEIMASEGMLKYLEEQHSEQEMELETV